jgi:hypothetical protein
MSRYVAPVRIAMPSGAAAPSAFLPTIRHVAGSCLAKTLGEAAIASTAGRYYK